MRFGFQGAESRERPLLSGAVPRLGRVLQRECVVLGAGPDFHLGYEEIEPRWWGRDAFEIAEVPSEGARGEAEPRDLETFRDWARRWFCRLSVQIRFAS